MPAAALAPILGHLSDNGGAYRRWQERMIRYRRGHRISRSSRPRTGCRARVPATRLDINGRDSSKR